jgi:hypothetical protein
MEWHSGTACGSFGKVFISCRRKQARRPRQHAYHQKTAAAINQASAVHPGLQLGSQWGSNPEPLIKYLPSPGLVNAGGLPRLPSQARITQVRYLNKDTVLYYLLRSSRLRRNKFDEVSRHPDVSPYYFPASPDGRE